MYDMTKVASDSWKYFNNRNVFDFINDLGYDYNNYANQVKANHLKQKTIHDIVKK